MNTHTPVVIDLTRDTLRKFDGNTVIRDASGDVMALCPLYAEPLPDGQFSYALTIQTAVNSYASLIEEREEMIKTLLLCREYLQHSLGSTSEVNPYPAIDAALRKAGAL